MSEPLKVHPAAEVFPMACERVIEEIAADMSKRGYDPKKPITRYRGMLLDGRNRLRAAAMAGVEPVFTDLPDDADPFEESKRANLQRRDLVPGQRAAILLKLKAGSASWQSEQERRKAEANKARAEKAKAQHAVSNPRAGESSGAPSTEGAPDAARSATAAALAKEAGVSRPTMERAMRLQRERPEDFEALVRGDSQSEREARKAQLRKQIEELEAKGLVDHEIASELGISPMSVSKSRTESGTAKNSPERKLRDDLDRFAASAAGMVRPAKDITEALRACGDWDSKEAKRWQSKVAEMVSACRDLLTELKRIR